MKQSIYTFALIALFAVSCAAQPAPKPATVRAKPAEPAVPTPPPQPPEPAVPETAALLEEAADQVARAKFNLGVIDPFADGEDQDRTLVLLRETGDSEKQSDIEDDLKVMTHILDKASTSPNERKARSVGIWFRSPFGGSPALRNMYVEGYGVVFFLHVNYSLTPPPSKPDDADAKVERDSDWEKARRELSSPRHSHNELLSEEFGSEPKPGGPLSEYDADKVEALQKNLAEALKNAVHIRALKTDETVTIVVTSRSPSPRPAKVKPYKAPGTGSAVAKAGSREKLVMRAKKSDIEAFQKDKLSLEAFRKKLSVSLN